MIGVSRGRYDHARSSRQSFFQRRADKDFVSQGVGIALGLAQQGRVVRVHDPLVEPSDARHALGDEVLVCATLEEALAGAAGVVVATAADAYHNLSSELGAPAGPVVVLDCWGRVLDAPSLEVHRIGRNGAGR